MRSIQTTMKSLKPVLTVLLTFWGSLWLSAGGTHAQEVDSLAICREIAETKTEAKIYDIVIDPLEVFHALSSGGETAQFFEGFVQSAAIPHFKKYPEDFESARLEVLKWKAPIEVINEFSDNLDWTLLFEKMNQGRALEAKEQAILIHGYSIKCFNSLRDSKALINDRAVKKLEAALEMSVELNETALRYDNQYRDRTIGIARSDVENLVLRRFTEDGQVVYDLIKTHFIEPLLESTFRDSLAEIDWLEKKISEGGGYIDDAEFTNKRVAFLNVLARVRLLLPKPTTYKWTSDDVNEFKNIVASVTGALEPASIQTIVSKSKQYQASQAAKEVRSGRLRRFGESAIFGRLGIASTAAVGSFLLWRMTRELVLLEKGFARSTSIYIDQMKANLPESLKTVQNLELKLSLALQAESPVISGVNLAKDTNIAFREAFDLGQKYYRHFNGVEARLAKRLGADAASKLRAAYEADLAALGAAKVAAQDRALASALNVFEEGNISLRAADKLARQQAALTPPEGYSSIKKFNKAQAKALRSVNSKLIEEAEILMHEQYLQNRSGAKTLPEFWKWMKYQKRKYLFRYWDSRKITNSSPNQLSIGQKINPLRWWRDVQKAGEIIPKGATYEGITPGESLAKTHRTLGELSRSVLHKLAWIAMIASVTFVAVDVYEAWTNRKLSVGFQDLKATPQGANPIDDAANETILRTHHTSKLISELVDQFVQDSQENELRIDSVNVRRLKTGSRQVEVIANMESLGGYNPDTGFFSTAYVLFKAYEESKDGAREDRFENAMSGVLVRFVLQSEGFNKDLAGRFGLKRDVPEEVKWVPEAMINLQDLDLEGRKNLEESIVIKEFRANINKPKIVIDPVLIEKVFSRAKNLLVQD